MQADQSVTVYRYWVVPPQGAHRAMSSDMATLDVIERELGSAALVGTAKLVPETEVDPQGHYRRIATGWGEWMD